MNKKMRNILGKAGSLLFAGALCFSTAFGVALPIMAAETDTIDMTRTGSITVHKYDQTAAQNSGVDLSVYTPTGEKDAAAEAALAAYAIEGVEFTYLKVSDIVTDSRAGNVEVVYAFEPQLRNILSLNVDDAKLTQDGKLYYTMQQINDSLKALLSNNTNGKNALEDYIKGAGGTAMPLTDDKGVTGADNLALGLYLIVETKVPENVFYTCDPFFTSVPSTDATGDYWFYSVDVYPKNQTDNPTLNKKVKSDETDAVYADTANVSGGETASYIFVSKLPEITSKASYLSVYTFTDQMSKGLEYNRDAIIYFYTSADAANQNLTDQAVAKWELTGGAKDKYAVSYTGNATSGSGMTVSMTDAGLAEINPGREGQYMVIAYTAKVSSDASLTLGDDGNPNDVTLEWRRSSSNYLDTMEDKAIVYVYGLDILKTFSDNKGNFSNVQFTLKNATDGHFLTATGSNGLYYVLGKAEKEDDVTKFVPGDDGKLIIRGLEADSYILTEIHTDRGYSLLKDDIKIDITGTEKTIIPSEAEITGTPNYTNAADYYAAKGNKVRKFVEVIDSHMASSKVDSSDAKMLADGISLNGLVDMNILNSKTPVLPQTGGMGLYAVTIIGIAAFAGGMFILFRLGKNKKKKA